MPTNTKGQWENKRERKSPSRILPSPIFLPFSSTGRQYLATFPSWWIASHPKSSSSSLPFSASMPETDDLSVSHASLTQETKLSPQAKARFARDVGLDKRRRLAEKRRRHVTTNCRSVTNFFFAHIATQLEKWCQFLGIRSVPPERFHRVRKASPLQNAVETSCPPCPLIFQRFPVPGPDPHAKAKGPGASRVAGTPGVYM
jgi:hypothetical protein